MAERQSASIRREREDFKSLWSHWKTVCGALTGIFTVLPIGGGFFEALLPDELGLIAPGLAVTLSILLIVLLYYTNRDSQHSRIGNVALIFFGVAVVCLFLFFGTWFKWVRQVDTQWQITGLTLTAEAQGAIAKKYVTNSSPKALLDRLGHHSADRIWEYRYVVKALLTLTFVLFFACVAGSFFLFTLRNLVQTREVSG